MEEQIKVLENDIMELTKMICKERMSQEVKQSMSCIVMDYNDYKKLVDTIVINFRIYLRFREVRYNNDTCIKYKEWLEREIKDVHILMERAKNNKYYDQYRCLNYVHIKLLDELNNYNLRKPFGMN